MATSPVVRSAVIAVFLSGLCETVAGQQGFDRTILPIQEPERPTYSELDARNVQPPPRFEVVGKGRIEKTQPLLFSADETADVGLDNQTPVVEGIGIGREETRFTGKIDKVVVRVKKEK